MKPDKAERMSACWQALDGNRFCSGEAIQYEVFLNIPNALVIEFDGVEDGEPWDIPKTLYPCRGDSAASGRGVKYSVVSHVYFQQSRSHYMTRYLSSEKRVFDHDGLLHGVSNRLRDLPAGFVLRAVVYHLEGGEEAGKYFGNSQMERAEKNLFLRFKTRSSSHTGIPTSWDLNRSDVEVVPNGDRWWLVDGKSSSTDYRATTSRSPKKRARVALNPIIPKPRTFVDLSDSDSAPSASSASFPPIETIESASLAMGMAHPLRCKPCGATGDAKDRLVVVDCATCGFWSHISCVLPKGTAGGLEFTEGDSVLNSGTLKSFFSSHDVGWIILRNTIYHNRFVTAFGQVELAAERVQYR
ncbi:hypothetical protein R3P38DRAFT_3482445 [Favolaschia claudopus]|uniref:Zinc finger PHD-type domain-containing protein n=1 Tax=Favolaschia claudopus TaxID=2862362 RepID=A0AAV9Z806_9AGAR